MHRRSARTTRTLIVGAAAGALGLGGATGALGLGPATAGAATITLQNGSNGYSGTTDTWLRRRSGHKDDNLGGSERFLIRNYHFGDPTSGSRSSTGLIRFDLGGVTVPTGQALQSATLTLTKYADGDSHFDRNGPSNVAFHRMLKGWVEGGATWNSPDKSTSATWSVGGAQGNGTDRVGTATDTVAVGSSAGNPSPDPTDGPYDWDVTSDVQAFLDGTADNHGWEFEDLNNAYTLYFRSSEEASATQDRPKLSLTFAAVPEPASLGLMAAGGLLLAGRRRRRA